MLQLSGLAITNKPITVTEKPNAAIPFFSSQNATTIEPALYLTHQLCTTGWKENALVARTWVENCPRACTTRVVQTALTYPSNEDQAASEHYGRRATRWTPTRRPRRSLPSNLSGGHPFCHQIPCQGRRHPDQRGHRALRKTER